MTSAVASLRLPDVVDMAHRRRRAGADLLACCTFLAAAHLARWADLRDHETVYLQRAFQCHDAVMRQG